jgi:hypothetical protein
MAVLRSPDCSGAILLASAMVGGHSLAPTHSEGNLYIRGPTAPIIND